MASELSWRLRVALWRLHPSNPSFLGFAFVCSGVAQSRTNHCHMTLDFWRAKQTSFCVLCSVEMLPGWLGTLKG